MTQTSHKSASTRAPAGDTPAGWLMAACPLCGAREHELIFEAENRLFDTNATVALRRCSCGMRLTNPQPRGDALARFYETDSYYTHAARPGLRDRLRRAVQRRQLRGPLARLRIWAETSWGVRRFARRFAPHAFTLERGLRLLDFGCGAGRTLRLARDLGLDAVGLEPDQQARRVAAESGCPVAASLAELEDLSAAAFDRVILMHVLEHLPEPADTLRKLTERLTPRGRMLITVPNADALQAEVFGAHWIGYDMPRHLWHFSPAELCRLAESVGLAVVSSETLELSWFAGASNEQCLKHSGKTIDYSPGNLRNLERDGRGTEIVLVACRSTDHRT